MPNRGQWTCARALAVLAAGLFTVLVLAGPAFAAGTGYGGGTTGGGGTPANPTTPPGYTTVLTSQTVQPSGGTVSAGGTTVTVPAGDFSTPTDVVLSQGSNVSGLPAGSTAVVAAGISFQQNGQKVTGTFPQPIQVTITNSSITSADQVVVYDAATGSYVPVNQAPDVTNVTVSNGSISFEVTGDPYVAVLAASAAPTGTVANATATQTGVPVLGEALGAALLVGAGLLLAIVVRRSSRYRRLS